MAQNHHSKRKERVYNEKKNWTKARLSPSKANAKSYSFMSIAKNAQIILSELYTSHMLLSLGLVPIPVISSPWQMYYTSGISNILGSSMQSRPQLHTSCRDSSTSHFLASKALWNCRGRFHNSFIYSCTLSYSEATPTWITFKFSCLLGMDSIVFELY